MSISIDTPRDAAIGWRLGGGKPKFYRPENFYRPGNSHRCERGGTLLPGAQKMAKQNGQIWQKLAEIAQIM